MDFIENEPNKIIKNNKNIIDDKNDLLNEEKKKNIELTNKIKQLEIDLNKEKDKNKILNKQIKKYKKIIKELHDKLSENNSVDNNKVLELQNIIKTKADEIDVLKSKLNDSSIDNIQPGEKKFQLGLSVLIKQLKIF